MSGCRSYRPGHQTHYIQARKSLENGYRVPARIVRVEPPMVVLDVAGAERTYFTDRASAIDAAAQGRHARLVIDDRWSVLRVGRQPFSVASPATWMPCDQPTA